MELEFLVNLPTFGGDELEAIVFDAIINSYGVSCIVEDYNKPGKYGIVVRTSAENVAKAKLQLIKFLTFMKSVVGIRDTIESVYNMDCYESRYHRIAFSHGEIMVENYIDRNGLPMRFKKFTNYPFKATINIHATKDKDTYEYYPDIVHKYPCSNDSHIKTSVKNENLYRLCYKFSSEGTCKDAYDMALMLIYNISKVIDNEELISCMAYDITSKALNWQYDNWFTLDSYQKTYSILITADIGTSNPIHMIDGKEVEDEDEDSMD